MKQLIITVAVTLLSIGATNAQIVLERNYNQHPTLEVYELETEGHMYAGINSIGDIQLYRPDHSIFKTIKPTYSGAPAFVTFGYVSQHLFDSDNDVELLLSYVDTSISGYPQSHVAVVDDNGGIIKDILYATAPRIREVSGKWKLIVTMNGAQPFYSDVYSLPGKWNGILAEPTHPSIEAKMYPNPMSSTATIEYELDHGGRHGKVNIYEMSSGKLVREYKVKEHKGAVTIQRGELPAGTYVYEILCEEHNQPSGSPVKFIIR